METSNAAARGPLVRSSLHFLHERLGAKMAPFAGWEMPLEYEGTLAEHEAVRADVGVFDVSHLGTIWVTGAGAEPTIAAAFTNDPSTLSDGTSQYTLCLTEDGTIADDLIVYRIASDRFLAIPNAANTRTVRDVLVEAARDHDADVEDVSGRTCIVAVQGPRSLEIVDRVFPDVTRKVDYRGIGSLELGPAYDGFLCRTGYTGEVGVELILPGDDAPGIFEELLDLGATPCGLGARDTLRLEMGYPLHGNDITPDTDPYEARLGWAVKPQHADDFRGRAALERRQREGRSRQLLGLRADGRGIPRKGMSVHRGDDHVGEVTSGTFSPTLRTGIALAYLDDPLGPGDRVEVDVRGKRADFEVVTPPFVDRDPRG